ncbi:MAG: kinase [Gammaproteobacteria bacterium]|nr:kinase [Gammaproteobacteria bacterium]
MIVSRSPYRISFFGGGTDYEPWFKENGGEFLSLTINYFTYITLRVKPEFQKKEFRILWRLAEEVDSVELIQHPIVRETLKKYGYTEKGLDISYIGDLPGGSGMGSSSAFTAALICALYADMGLPINPYELSNFSYDIEKNKLNETVGIQDQIATSFGGFNHVTIDKDASYQVTPVNLSSENLDNFIDRLVLVYTNKTRRATSFAEQKVRNMKNKVKSFHELQKMVSVANSYLLKNELLDFGNLLNESWLIKRSLTETISDNDIDNLYNYGIKNGAIGGKLLGAGGGGFILFMAKEGHKEKLLNSFKNETVFPFKISSKGTEIVYNEGNL